MSTVSINARVNRSVPSSMDWIADARAEDAAAEVAAAIRADGGEAMCVRADCTDADAVNNMVDAVIRSYDKIDYLVNNAGMGVRQPLDQLTESDFEKILRTNLTSAFLVNRTVTPHMLEAKFGRLIFMSSIAAHTGGALSAAYAASKAGLEGLMHYYVTAFAKTGVTSNAVAPALIASDMVESTPHRPAQQLPMGRLGQPNEVWPAVRMLFDSSYVTGQTIHVNAGMYMT